MRIIRFFNFSETSRASCLSSESGLSSGSLVSKDSSIVSRETEDSVPSREIDLSFIPEILSSSLESFSVFYS
jgi:hypothetical protein